MKRIDWTMLPMREGSAYPPPFSAACAERQRWRLGEAAALTQFGVNRLRLPPGAWSSQRHWHSAEDEFVCVLAGEVVLVTDAGEEVLRAGDCAAFPKGVANGHQLVNRSGAPCVFIAIGRPAASDCHYPGIDLHLDGASNRYTRKDGTPYETGVS